MSELQHRLTRIQLLSPVIRWTPLRKATLFNALKDHIVTVDEVCSVHGFSHDELDAEFMAWVRGGTRALKVTKRDRLAMCAGEGEYQ